MITAFPPLLKVISPSELVTKERSAVSFPTLPSPNCIAASVEPIPMYLLLATVISPFSVKLEDVVAPLAVTVAKVSPSDALLPVTTGLPLIVIAVSKFPLVPWIVPSTSSL